jgi:hypothetical protein
MTTMKRKRNMITHGNLRNVFAFRRAGSAKASSVQF